MSRYLIVILIFVSAINCFGQTSAPKYSNEFLAIGVGARGLAMSGNQVATVSDATAGYWNPAGLLNSTSKYNVSIMHAEYFAGIAKYDFVAFSTPIDTVSHIAASIIRFAIDDIPDTRFLYDANGALNYNNIRFFSAADYAFLISYARKLPVLGGLKIGGNSKVVHRVAGSFANAWGFGFDIGAQLDYKGWNFGVMINDVTGTFNAWNHNTDQIVDVFTQTGNEIPDNSIEVTLPRATFGVARYFQPHKNIGALVALDFVTSFDGQRNVLIKSEFASIDPAFGVELDYKKTIFLRFGVGDIQEVKDFDNSTFRTYQPNFGIGFKVKSVTIDYALTDIGDQSESLYSNVFSLKAEFN